MYFKYLNDFFVVNPTVGGGARTILSVELTWYFASVVLEYFSSMSFSLKFPSSSRLVSPGFIDPATSFNLLRAKLN